ncbi:MAG: endolytic transglycosylase MltG [Candidatus Paceibacterota bacterium]|jgi:UPF0755 protein
MKIFIRYLKRIVNKKYRSFFIASSAIVFLSVVILIFVSIAPSNFPEKKIISIEKNLGLSQVADLLLHNNVIKHPNVYKAFVVILGGSKKVIAGDYLFDSPQSALRIAYRTIKGIQGLKKIKVTIPEGLASSDIGRLLTKNIPGFDEKKFRSLAKRQEGYLFPDTYFFYENVEPEKIIDMMHSNFDRQIESVKMRILASGKSLEDVIKMASIVEEEAASSTDRKIIAGILWKRLESDMPLQIDAPFFYILGKTSAQLTRDDLAMDSPYNLYKNKGLPATPISNPGLGSIQDVLNPINTKYWFYLADSKGITHYAEDHEGHLENIRKYLQ